MALGLAERLLGGDLVFALHAAVAAKVQHPHAPLAHYPADQQPAVAVGRIFLAAEDGHAILADAAQQPLDPLLEAGRSGQAVVQYMAPIVAKAVVFHAAADQIAEKQILDRPAV